MRARRLETASGSSCDRCAAVLLTGVSACSLCGWPVGMGFPEPLLEATDVDPEPEPEDLDAAPINAAAAAQLETLDALTDEQLTSTDQVDSPETDDAAVDDDAVGDETGGDVDTGTGGGAPERTDAPVMAGVAVASGGRTLDPLTAPLALLIEDRPSDFDDLADLAGPDLGADLLSQQPALPVTDAPRHQLHRLAGVVTVLAGLVGALSVLVPVLSWLVAVEGDSALAPVVAAASIALLVAWGIAGTTFLLWVLRARSNAEQQSSVRQRWPRTLAVVGWCIPVAGLFIGWQVLQDLWSASDPATRDVEDARPPEPLLVTGWLAAIAVASVVSLAGTVVLGGSALVDVVAGAAVAVSATCLALVVRQVSQWQDATGPARVEG